MEKFLEFCFCCPCCYTAMQITKHSTRDIRSRFKSVGWVAKSNDNCINCGECVDVCPQHAITPGQFGIVIDDQCFGCGLCKNSCNSGAIEIIPKNELIKEDIKVYFSGLNLEL